MKKAALLPFIALWFTSYCTCAQVTDTPKLSTRKDLVSLPSRLPLYLVNSKETNASALIVNKADLQVLHVFKKPTEVQPYGEKGKNGVIVAEVKGNPELYRLDGVLNHFKVENSQRKLKVLLNNLPVNTDLLLADVRQIEKVEVTRQSPLSPILASLNADEEFLNIVTKQ